MSSCFDAAPNRWTAATADESLGLAPWLTLALVLHGAIALAHRAAPKPDAIVTPPLQIDLAPPEPPALRSPEPEAAAPVPEATARPAASHPKAAVEPRVFARAGKVLTAGDAQEAGDPVSFVTDPEGNTYGAGVVAKGAVAERSTEPDRSPVKGPEGAPSARADALTALSDLSRRPALEGDDPCRGFFPSRADRDEGRVTLNVVVQPTGAVGAVTVIGETPVGEGFGDAARTCLAAQKFVPALDRAGRPTRTATQVRIHFTR
jgi:TonB family protein